MKQPKRPTYSQKKEISKHGLNWKEWQVEYQDGGRLGLIHKGTGERKEIGA